MSSKSSQNSRVDQRTHSHPSASPVFNHEGSLWIGVRVGCVDDLPPDAVLLHCACCHNNITSGQNSLEEQLDDVGAVELSLAQYLSNSAASPFPEVSSDPLPNPDIPHTPAGQSPLSQRTASTEFHEASLLFDAEETNTMPIDGDPTRLSSLSPFKSENHVDLDIRAQLIADMYPTTQSHKMDEDASGVDTNLSEMPSKYCTPDGDGDESTEGCQNRNASLAEDLCHAPRAVKSLRNIDKKASVEETKQPVNTPSYIRCTKEASGMDLSGEGFLSNSSKALNVVRRLFPSAGHDARRATIPKDDKYIFD